MEREAGGTQWWHNRSLYNVSLGQEKDLFRNLIERGESIIDPKVEYKFLSSELKQLEWIRGKSDLYLLFIFLYGSSLEGPDKYLESSFPWTIQQN